MLAYYKPNSFLGWSFGDLLAGTIPTAELKGSIVLMGSRAPSLRDSFETPFTRFGHQANLATMDGIELHAQRRPGLLDRQAGGHYQMEALPAWFSHGLLLLTLGVGLLVGERLTSLSRSALLLVLLELLLLGGSGPVGHGPLAGEQSAHGRPGGDGGCQLGAAGQCQSGATPPV
jgi:adenylate cyclase